MYVARNEYIEEVTSFTLNGDIRHINLLPQELSITLKEPCGEVYSDNSTQESDPKSLEAREHISARVLSAIVNEGQTKQCSPIIRQLTDGSAWSSIDELEEKKKMANESIEGLVMDIASAWEEITRWKVAAEQEAASGKAIEHKLTAQVSALASLWQELEEAKHVMLDAEEKLKFK